MTVLTPNPGPSPNPNRGPGPGPATVRPRYGEASLADVLPSTLAVLGQPGAVDQLGLGADIGAADGVRTMVVLLLDGFGYYQLPVAAPWAPTIAALATGRLPGSVARAITTGFPTTTPTSLASLGTGAAPGAHGLVGFFLNVPGTDRVLNHIKWDNEPDPLRWQPLPTQFDLARAAGISAHVVSQPEFEGSGLSRAVWRGGEYVGASGPDAVASSILDTVRRRTGPGVVYGYLSDVDRAGHAFGVDSPQWRDAVAEVDRMVTRLVEALPPDAALIVTADHGQINVPAERRFDLSTDPRLTAGLRLVAGEARVRYLHTVPGARDDVLAAWRGILGDAARVVSREEAIADGWFGPVSADHLARVGDVVVTCHEDYVVLASATDPAQVAEMIAFHGSATAAEMMIPLLLFRRP